MSIRSRAAILGFVLLAGGAAAWAFSGGRIYRNDALRIQSFEVPRGWDIVSQVAYPRLVVIATGAPGQRLTLAVQRVSLGTTADLLAADARVTLERQGFTSPRLTHADDRLRLDATFDKGRKSLRQIYFIEGDLAYVLTVATPTVKAPRAFRDLEDASRSLVIDPMPPGGAPATSDGGVTD